MTSNFCQSVVKVSLAQICQSLGWNSMHSTPMDLLVDIMERYIQTIGRTTQKYAEQFGRSDASYGDTLLALTDMGLCLPDLLDYMKNVEPIEFAKKVPSFPVPKPCKLIYDDYTSESDQPGYPSSPQHPTAASGPSSSPYSTANRRSLTATSHDQSWHPRPLQELSNSEFRARCRLLLDADGPSDVEEKFSKAPDPRPPLQMAQIMRQRRPPPSILPITINAVASGLVSTGIESYPDSHAGGSPQPHRPQPRRDRSSLSKGASKRNKGSSKLRAPDPRRRREKAAAAKQKKRDQGYTALAEALSVPLAVQSVSGADWSNAVPDTPSRSASSLHAVAPASELPHKQQRGEAAGDLGSAAHSSRSRASARSGGDEEPAYLRHLDDALDAVLRQATEDLDEESKEEDVDVEEVNLLHEQLASPPPQLLPLIPPSFAASSHSAAVLPSPRGRSTVDDVIDSVVRGEGGMQSEGEEATALEGKIVDSSFARKAIPEVTEDKKKRKKSKHKSRTKLNAASAAVECAIQQPLDAVVALEEVVSPAPIVPSVEQGHGLREDIAVNQSSDALVNIVDDDIEVVHEVEVEHGDISGPPPLQVVSALSVDERLHPALEDASHVSGGEEFAALSVDPDGVLHGSLLPNPTQVEKKREKHKKEKKEKKKKKNKERHREKQANINDDDGASQSSLPKVHGHKDHRKSDKEHHRHKHRDGTRDVDKKHSHGCDHHRKTKDKTSVTLPSAIFNTGDAEAKHKPGLTAEGTSTAAIPKLLFKIAGGTISSVSQGDADSRDAMPAVFNAASDSVHPHVTSAQPPPAPRAKATEIYTETEFTAGTRDVASVARESDDSKVWICPTCRLPDDGSPMIGCDRCDRWYHWTCVGVVTPPPDDAMWYCPDCSVKKPSKKKSKHSSLQER